MMADRDGTSRLKGTVHIALCGTKSRPIILPAADVADYETLIVRICYEFNIQSANEINYFHTADSGCDAELSAKSIDCGSHLVVTGSSAPQLKVHIKPVEIKDEELRPAKSEKDEPRVRDVISDETIVKVEDVQHDESTPVESEKNTPKLCGSVGNESLVKVEEIPFTPSIVREIQTITEAERPGETKSQVTMTRDDAPITSHFAIGTKRKHIDEIVNGSQDFDTPPNVRAGQDSEQRPSKSVIQSQSKPVTDETAKTSWVRRGGKSISINYKIIDLTSRSSPSKGPGAIRPILKDFCWKFVGNDQTVRDAREELDMRPKKRLAQCGLAGKVGFRMRLNAQHGQMRTEDNLVLSGYLHRDAIKSEQRKLSCDVFLISRK